MLSFLGYLLDFTGLVVLIGWPVIIYISKRIASKNLFLEKKNTAGFARAAFRSNGRYLSTTIF